MSGTLKAQRQRRSHRSFGKLAADLHVDRFIMSTPKRVRVLVWHCNALQSSVQRETVARFCLNESRMLSVTASTHSCSITSRLHCAWQVLSTDVRKDRMYRIAY